MESISFEFNSTQAKKNESHMTKRVDAADVQLLQQVLMVTLLSVSICIVASNVRHVLKMRRRRQLVQVIAFSMQGAMPLDHNGPARLNEQTQGLTPVDLQQISKGEYPGVLENLERQNQTLCAVCLDEYNDGDEVRVLPCEHIYHVACVDEWFARSTACPLCKAPAGDAPIESPTPEEPLGVGGGAPGTPARPGVVSRTLAWQDS